jgi:hypothetical protein
MRYGKLLTIVIILSISLLGCSLDRNNAQNKSEPEHVQANNEPIFILLDSVYDPLPPEAKSIQYMQGNLGPQQIPNANLNDPIIITRMPFSESTNAPNDGR